jgi:hypothetical protein
MMYEDSSNETRSEIVLGDDVAAIDRPQSQYWFYGEDNSHLPMPGIEPRSSSL